MSSLVEDQRLLKRLAATYHISQDEVSHHRALLAGDGGLRREARLAGWLNAAFLALAEQHASHCCALRCATCANVRNILAMLAAYTDLDVEIKFERLMTAADDV